MNDKKDLSKNAADAPESIALLKAVSEIKQARDRDSRATDDGGSSGRSDTNDNTIF